MSTIASVSAILDRPPLRDAQVADGVWRLEGKSRDIERCKVELLDAICRLGSPFLHYDEDLPEQGPLARLRSPAPGVWRIPQGVTGRALHAWLHLGNWQMYLGENELSYLPDLCRADPEGVEEFLGVAGVSLVIDAFHDDTLWVLGVAQASV